MLWTSTASWNSSTSSVCSLTGSCCSCSSWLHIRLHLLSLSLSQLPPTATNCHQLPPTATNCDQLRPTGAPVFSDVSGSPPLECYPRISSCFAMSLKPSFLHRISLIRKCWLDLFILSDPGCWLQAPAFQLPYLCQLHRAKASEPECAGDMGEPREPRWHLPTSCLCRHWRSLRTNKYWV